MAVQPTLFGTPLSKGRFFRGLANPDKDAGYYAVIEALCTVHKSSDKTSVFAVAQRKWTVTCRVMTLVLVVCAR